MWLAVFMALQKRQCSLPKIPGMITNIFGSLLMRWRCCIIRNAFTASCCTHPLPHPSRHQCPSLLSQPRYEDPRLNGGPVVSVRTRHLGGLLLRSPFTPSNRTLTNAHLDGQPVVSVSTRHLGGLLLRPPFTPSNRTLTNAHLDGGPTTGPHSLPHHANTYQCASGWSTHRRHQGVAPWQPPVVPSAQSVQRLLHGLGQAPAGWQPSHTRRRSSRSCTGCGGEVSGRVGKCGHRVIHSSRPKPLH